MDGRMYAHAHSAVTTALSSANREHFRDAFVRQWGYEKIAHDESIHVQTMKYADSEREIERRNQME